MLHRRNISGLCLLMLFMTLIPGQPARAKKISPQELVDSLENSNVFAPGTRVSVQITGKEARVSIYKNVLANDKDCKIEAALAAKTIIDLYPDDIVRVTVFFFEKNLSNYNKADVSIGDIKSFQSGQISKEKLVDTIQLRRGTLLGASNRVASFLEASKSPINKKSIRTKIKGKDIDILVYVDGWVTDDELKLEALKIALKTLEAMEGYKRVHITFADPKGEFKDRNIDFSEAEITSLNSKLNAITNLIELRGESKWLPSERYSSDVEILSIRAVPGFAHDKRKELLKQIKELESLGVGVDPFLDAFFKVENAVAAGDEEEINRLLKALEESLAEQKERHRLAKNYDPNSDPKSDSKPAATPQKVEQKPTVEVIDESGMDAPSIRKKILANPKGQLNYWRLRYKKGDHGPHDFPNYARLLKLVIKVLNENNRQAGE